MGPTEMVQLYSFVNDPTGLTAVCFFVFCACLLPRRLRRRTTLGHLSPNGWSHDTGGKGHFESLRRRLTKIGAAYTALYTRPAVCPAGGPWSLFRLSEKSGVV